VLWISGVGVATWRTFPVYGTTIFWDAILNLGILVPEKEKQLAERAPWEEELPDAPWTIAQIKQRQAVQFATVLALVPPVFVLALGTAFVWAFRGFR